MSQSVPKSVLGKGSAPATLSPVSSRPKELTRIHTGQHPDDHSYYHVDIDQADSTSDDTGELEQSKPEDDHSSVEGGIGNGPETSAGATDEKDVEKTANPLEKKKSSRSIKDPNLVRLPHSFTYLRLS